MEHYGSSNIDSFYSHLQRIKMNTNETLIDFIDDLKIHSCIAKLKTTNSWYRAISKVTTGVKNTAGYIPWLCTTWDQMVASNIIHCVLVLMTTTIKQAFLFQVQTRLAYYFKANHPHIIKN